MGGFPAHLFAALVVWAIVAIAIYHRARRLPDYSYEDARRDPASSPSPSYHWYYSIPDPMTWAALCFAGIVLAGVAHARHDPVTLTTAFSTPSYITLWLNDVGSDTLAVMPNSVPWSAILLGAVAPIVLFRFFALVSAELTSVFFPSYARYRVGLPRRFAKKFLAEIKADVDKLRSPWERYCRVLIGCVLLYLLTQPVDGTVMAASLLAALVGNLICIQCLSRPRQRLCREEFRKRFDSARLVSVWRSMLWKMAFRTWVVIPLAVMAVAYTVPLYVFDQDGIRERRYGEENLIPWNQVTSLNVGFTESLSRSKRSVNKKQSKERLLIHVAFSTAQGTIDINGWGGLSWDVGLFKRILERARGKNVLTECVTEPQAEKQINAYLTDPHIGSEFYATFRLIHELCPPRG